MMLRMPISSGMTRCSIWPSVSIGLDLRPAPLEQCAPAFREVQGLAPPEGVVVGDDDPRLFEVLAACRAVRARGSRSSCPGRSASVHAEPVADGQARRDHKEARA